MIILDGLERWEGTDPACSLRWLPAALPRYVHAVLGFGQQGAAAPSAGRAGGALPVAMGRAPAPVVARLRGLDPDVCRQRLQVRRSDGLSRWCLWLSHPAELFAARQYLPCELHCSSPALP